jgi:hypothetical protein
MWFGLLGPLQVLDGRQSVPVPGARERMLLAALLLRAGRAVPSEQLAEIVWDGAPTERSVVTLRSYVMRLRRCLGPAAGERITTTSCGYQITVAEDEFGSPVRLLAGRARGAGQGAKSLAGNTPGRYPRPAPAGDGGRAPGAAPPAGD